jgi:hypothetical protein
VRTFGRPGAACLSAPPALPRTSLSVRTPAMPSLPVLSYPGGAGRLPVRPHPSVVPEACPSFLTPGGDALALGQSAVLVAGD